MLDNRLSADVSESEDGGGGGGGSSNSSGLWCVCLIE